MVKLIFEIEEKDREKIKDLDITGVNVEIYEEWKKETSVEKKVAKMFRKRIGEGKNINVVNECKNEKNYEIIKAVEEFINSI